MNLGHNILIYLLFLGVLMSPQLLLGQDLTEEDQQELSEIISKVNTITGDTAQIMALIDHTWKNMRNAPLVSLKLLDHLDQYYQDTSFTYRKPQTIYYKGVLHKNLGNAKQSEKYLLEYIDLMQAKGAKRNLMAGMQALGNLYTNLNQYAKAIDLYTQSLDKYFDKKDSIETSRIYTRLGYFMSEVEDYEQSLLYNEKALNLLSNYQTTVHYINTLNDRGILFEKQELWDSMFYYYQKCLDASNQFGDQSNKLFAHYNLGAGFDKVENLEQALMHYDKAIMLAYESSNKIMQWHAHLGAANILFKKGQLEKSLEHLTKVDTVKSDLEIVVNRDELMSNILFLKGNYKKAFDRLKSSKTASDSLSRRDTYAKIISIENKFDRKQKEYEILELKNSEQEALLIAKQSQQRSLTFFGGLLMTLLLLFGGGYLYLLTRRKNAELEDKNKTIAIALQEKEMLLQEIHHRVKNNLQVISSLLSLQSRSSSDDNTTSALNEGKQRINSMALIHQHLYSGKNITGVSMKDYLNDLCKSIFAAHNVKTDRVTLDLNIDDIELDITTVVPLGLILNELITNSCKYAFPDDKSGFIKINLIEKNHQLELTVEDNGIGSHSDHKGFGTKLIEILVKKMKATVNVDNNGGMKYFLLIRNYKKA